MNLGGAIHLNKTGIGILCGLFIVLFIYTASYKGSKDIGDETTCVDLRKLLQVAVKAAEYGGKKVVETKDKMQVQSKGLTKEGLQDSVTTADFLSHCAMTSIFNHHFTGLKIISEENPSCSKDEAIDYSLNISENLPEEKVYLKDITVWIDPLDATHEYTGIIV